MGGNLNFFKNYAWPIVFVTSGVLVNGYGTVSDAYGLYTAGVPNWAFTVFGLLAFLVAFVVALYIVTEKAAAFAQQPVNTSLPAAASDDASAVAPRIEGLEMAISDLSVRVGQMEAAAGANAERERQATEILRSLAVLHLYDGLPEKLRQMKTHFQRPEILAAQAKTSQHGGSSAYENYEAWDHALIQFWSNLDTVNACLSKVWLEEIARGEHPRYDKNHMSSVTGDNVIEDDYLRQEYRRNFDESRTVASKIEKVAEGIESRRGGAREQLMIFLAETKEHA